MCKNHVEITLSDDKDAEKALNILNSLDCVSDCILEKSKITVVMRDEAKSSDILNALVGNGVGVEEMRRVTRSLEDVYLDIVQNGRRA